MAPNFNIFFDFKEVIKEIKGKQVRIAVLLIDNAGYTCGIYSNFKDAKLAIPKIKKNILFDLRKRLLTGRSIPPQFLNS